MFKCGAGIPVAVRGTTIRGIAVRRIATGDRVTTGTTMWVSEWLFRV
jgi:hypothetical protein